MLCQNCGHDNPEGNRFCGGCGNGLEKACAGCGNVNPPNHQFCGKCGRPFQAAEKAYPLSAPREPTDYTPKHLADKILNSRSALEGERKRVTVLFADIKQSTELAAALDIEDWHKILDRFFALLSDGIHRYEGTINQYTGDGIMALFGAPVTHEDDAQRACRASLSLLDEVRAYAREIKRWHGVDFQIRIGLNSGEVVVGKIGDDLRMDYTAQGQVVHIAARAQELAEAGTACLAPDTAEQVAAYFELENLGEFRIKGIDTSMCLYQLVGAGAASSRFDVARSRGLTSFVGRSHEMQILEAALEQARAGNGQVVGIDAEAGIGKSRLCFEFLQTLRNRGLKVLYGTCVAHGKNLPFHPILQVLRSYYGISDQDNANQAREKISRRMFSLGEGYREVLPLICEFLGVADPDSPAPQMAPEAKQRRLFGALREGLRQGVEPGQQVGIVIIEDLHWIDEGSDEWISQWVESTAGAQSLLVVNFRPEYRAPWTQRTHYQQISLAPLALETIRELLASMLGNDPSIAGLVDRVYAETGGNPFYAEEVVQTLIESDQLVGDRGAYVLARQIDTIE
ncbi:MAG: AAA family ATPase, partial [Proteobacteria bacterium]|nr:AAA family ATPase [Pseudomonadota bacterium]